MAGLGVLIWNGSIIETATRMPLSRSVIHVVRADVLSSNCAGFMPKALPRGLQAHGASSLEASGVNEDQARAGRETTGQHLIMQGQQRLAGVQRL